MGTQPYRSVPSGLRLAPGSRQCKRATEGYFILDTGSPNTIVSKRLVPPSTHTQHSAFRDPSRWLPPRACQLACWRAAHLDLQPAAIDTAEISARNGTEIAGAIGYSV